MDTIAVPAVLAAYNWAPGSERYRKLTQFVDGFFTKFPALQNPPFHPKWKETSLSAPLAGWTRLPYAQQWLDQHNLQPVARTKFDEFMKQNPPPAARGGQQYLQRSLEGTSRVHQPQLRTLLTTPPLPSLRCGVAL